MKSIFSALALCVILNCTVQAQQTFGIQDLSQNLLLHYNFDNNANDFSGNEYHATPFNVTYAQDRFGNANAACYFNGTNSYVNFPNLAALKPVLPISFSFWVNYASNSYQKQVVFNTSMMEDMSSSVVFNATAGDNNYVINCSDGSNYYAPDSRRSYVSNSTITPNSWHFIVITVSSETNMKIYVDCMENGGYNSGSGGNLQYSTNPGCLGRHDRSLSADPDYFHGAIDDFRYWGKLLSMEDIMTLCDEELSVATTVVPEMNFNAYIDLTSDLLLLKSGQSIKEVTIYDASGRNVFIGKYESTIDVSHFESGIYIVKAQTEFGIATKKVVKN